MEERGNNHVTTDVLYDAMTDVLYDVMKERARQEEKFSKEHDDSKLPMDWCTDIDAYTTWAHQMQRMGSMDKYRRRLIQVAALAIAACESLDRKITREMEVPNFGD